MMACLRPAPLPYETGCWRSPDGESLRLGGPDLTGHAIDCGGWQAGDAVIDLGCGNGAGLGLLRARGISAIGIDVSPAAATAARLRDASLRTVAADGENLPFPTASFDGALMECSLSLMADAERALAEVRRILVPGGRIVVADLYRRAAASPPEDDPARPACIAGLRTHGAWEELLAAQGFRVVLWEDRTNVLTAFVGRIILAGGALGDLWSGADDDGAAERTAAAMKRIRPGYALIAARREDEPKTGGFP